MIKNKRKTIIGIILSTIVISTILFSNQIAKVDAEGQADIGGSTAGGSGCIDPKNCWPFPDGGTNKSIRGIRVSVVDNNGNMISARSMDYLSEESHVRIINTDKRYTKCTNHTRNKVSYIKQNTSCNWANELITVKHASWLPDVFFDSSASNTIKNYILNNYNNIRDNIFQDIGYNAPSKEKRKNHYVIVEPVTYVTYLGDRYYGTYHELSNKMPTSGRPVLKKHLPYSMYIVGNENIGGDGGFKNNSYFDGAIKVVNMKNMTNSSGVTNSYEDKSYGWGLGIYWLYDFDNLKDPFCSLDTPDHFTTSTSGPNKEDCCQYVIDHQSEYNITKAELFSRYPRCRALLLEKECNFNLTTIYPSCKENAYGKISDIDNWDCIYASAYSTDSSIKNYFLKYGSINSKCSVYCRDEIEYIYPGNGMITLAGNFFTIAGNTNSYTIYTDDVTKTTKVKAATLGPVKTTIKRECSILGENDSTCSAKLDEQLNNLKAPEIEFAYESKYYNNPVENLRVSKTTTSTNNSNGIKSKTITYEYALPKNTYQYISKGNGASYKKTSAIGNYPYIKIGPHLPIHFSEKSSNDYQLTIKKFNIPNFDSLILKGKTMSTTFVSSIESYIQTLINNGSANPRLINGRYYLDQTFVKLLNKNNYTVDEFLSRNCANTNTYSCDSDGNGIYCLDKNKNTNSEQTYKNFNACIKKEVQKDTSDKKSYKNDMLYSCEFQVKNTITPSENDPYKCKYIDGKYYGKNGNVVSKNTYNKECNTPDKPNNPDDCDPEVECCDPECPNPINPNGINVIFRPISLDNPFPSIDGDGRNTGTNWCYNFDCNNKNEIVSRVITNNRDVETEKVYKDLDPLYTITLTPATIKEIRKYNKKNNYDDFNLKCTDGYNCLSNFIRNDFKKYFKGCGIKGLDNGLNCVKSDKW